MNDQEIKSFDYNLKNNLLLLHAQLFQEYVHGQNVKFHPKNDDLVSQVAHLLQLELN